MHREVSSQRSIYTQKSSLHKGDLHTESLNTDTFTHRKFYTQKRLRRTETFTQSSFYTQKLLHKKDFIQRSFYTQELLHKETFTQDSFYTQKLFTPRSLTHRSLRTDAFTQRSLYTEGTNLESETSRESETKIPRGAPNACSFFTVCRAPNRVYFVVPGLVCLLGNCCRWFLCNVCNLQSFTLSPPFTKALWNGRTHAPYEMEKPGSFHKRFNLEN